MQKITIAALQYTTGEMLYLCEINGRQKPTGNSIQEKRCVVGEATKDAVISPFKLLLSLHGPTLTLLRLIDDTLHVSPKCLLFFDCLM
jgi:hypothetical protein